MITLPSQSALRSAHPAVPSTVRVAREAPGQYHTARRTDVGAGRVKTESHQILVVGRHHVLVAASWKQRIMDCQRKPRQKTVLLLD